MPMSYPFRDGAGLTGAAGRRPRDRHDRDPGRRGQRRGRADRADPGRGRLHRPAPRASCRPSPPGAKDNGALFIADEIQTGFCRTGDWFACEHEGVVPDLITTAKGIAGGLPLAAVTGRAEIMDAVHPGGLGGTYGGNPVACAAALGAIETMRELDLAGAARAIEATMLPRLRGHAGSARRDRRRPRARRHDRHRDWSSRAPPSPTRRSTGRSPKACHAEGVVVLTAGTYGNVLRFLPPLVIGQDLLAEALDVIDAAFASEAAAR